MKVNIFDYFTAEEKKDYEEAEVLRLSKDKKEQWLGRERQRAIFNFKFRQNFLLFVDLLGYKDIGQFHIKEIKKLQESRFLSDKPVRRLWLWSRGFFKTSIITEAHTLWLIVNNPDIRVLIVSFSLDVAKKPFSVIRNTFASNEMFRYFFREFCPKVNKEGKVEFGTTEEFTIPNRTKTLKEPTVKCVGVGTNITGLHFDWIKPDDLVTKDSVTNDTQIQASKTYYSLLRPLYDNPTIPREDVVGTIYHFNDLHSNLINNLDFEKSIIPAKENDVFNFPERLNEEGWNSLLRDPNIRPEDIQQQWLLRPCDPSKAKFKESWLKTYYQLPEGVAEYICVDPASTQKKKSDYTVIERWGIDHKGLHYLIEGVRDKLTAYQRIDRLFEIARRCNRLSIVKYEVLGGRHGDIEMAKAKMAETQFFFNIQETKASNASKQDRIEQRLVPPFNAGSVLFPVSLPFRSLFDGKTYDFIQLYKLEYLQFPFTEHDDILDCHSQMFEEPTMLSRGNKPVTLQVKHRFQDMTADEWEKYYKTLEKLDTPSKFNKAFGKQIKSLVAR